MIEFFTSSTFRTVLSALNSGFLKTLQLFFITLIGALPLGLVISFGSMSRLAPFARDVADQVIFMDGGVIVEQGDAHQVIEHPREERTRQFLARYSEG